MLIPPSPKRRQHLLPELLEPLWRPSRQAIVQVGLAVCKDSRSGMGYICYLRSVVKCAGRHHHSEVLCIC